MKRFTELLAPFTLRVIILSIGLGFIFNYLIGYIFFEPSSSIANYIGWGLYLAIYSYNLHHFWIIVEANHRVVLQNTMLFSNNDQDRTLRPKGQRVIFEGINSKYPWETIVNKPIQLIKKVININVTAQSSNGIPMTVTGVGIIEPIPDQSLVQFYMNDEDSTIKEFAAKISLEIQTAIRENSSDNLVLNPKTLLQDRIRKLFNGENITNEERILGKTIHQLSISSIKKRATTQAIEETHENLEKITGIIRKTVEAAGPEELTQHTALGYVLRQKPKNIRTINIIKD